MHSSWKIGRVAGIDLHLHVTFLVMMGMLAMTHHGLGAVALVSALFGCVVLHELGHALMARRFGIPTEGITLYPIGGVARLRRMPRAPGAELLIALAGPAVNVAIVLALLAAGGLAGLLAMPVTGATGALLGELLAVNVLLAGFNLIPIFPMDGGRVLRALLSGRLGRLRATEIAASIGQWLALLAGVGCLAVMVATGDWFLVLQVVLAGFVYLAAGAELAQVRAEEGRLGRPADSPNGYSWIYRGNGVWQLAPAVVLDDDRGYRGRRTWL